MNKNYLFSFTALLAAVSLTGCQKQDSYDKYVTLGEYTDMTVDRIITTITDEDVNYEIQNDLYTYADYNEITDRGAQNGDSVNIDYTGTIDGEEFDGGSDTDFDLELGSGMFLPEFEDGLLGMNTGDTKEIEITFPEDYDGEVDGETAVFSVTLNSISEVILPEYNDTYVQETYGFDSVEEFEAYVKADLQEQYDEDSDYTACADALALAVDNASFHGYPEDMYDSVKAQIEAENEEFAEQLGMEWTDLVGEDYDIEEDILYMLHEKLVVYAIAEKEKLTVTDEELDNYAEENWELYEYDSKEEFLKGNNESELRYNLLYDKVLAFLQEHNTFQDIAEEDYYSDEEFDEDDLEVELPEDEEILEDEDDTEEFSEEMLDELDDAFAAEDQETDSEILSEGDTNEA